MIVATVFALFATLVLANVNPNGLPIYHGGAYAENGLTHKQVLNLWIQQNVKSDRITYVKVTDDRGEDPTYWLVTYNGSWFDDDKTTEQDYEDSVHRADFQQFQELFSQMYFFSIGHWKGRGLGISGDSILATNRLSTARYVKSIRTGTVTITEIP